jgi:predicted methyltransferase
MRSDMTQYAELHCLSNFTFLRGASHPQELVDRAYALGYRALAITDECSVAGVVRAHLAAKACGLPLIVGAEFHLRCGLAFVALATDRRGYGSLCRLITRGRRAAEKGCYDLGFDDVDALLEHCLVLWLPPANLTDEARLASMAAQIRERFADEAWLAVELLREGDDAARLAALTRLGERTGLPLVASGDVHMHVRARRCLQDALTAIRLGVPVAEAGHALHRNGERYLRERGRLVAAHYARDAASESQRTGRARFEEKLAAAPALYDRTVVVTQPGPGHGFIGELAPGSADLVLTFRNIHNWIEAGHLEGSLRAVHAALRPGGVLGVEEHRAVPGTSVEQMMRSGYVEQDWFVRQAHAAGFVLDGASEANANPRDTRDHPHGVWSLPPTLRGGEADRARYMAIGESDRMTLRLLKPRG